MAKQKYFVEIGQKFGHWIVIGERLARRVLCQCDCPERTERLVAIVDLFCGKHKSCGCARHGVARKHGDTKNGQIARLYRIWSNMKNRCNNPRNSDYKDYGGRGIEVCPEWQSAYALFKEWSLAHGYAEDLQIDRSDNGGGYSPDNCHWVPAKENMRNRRSCLYVTAFGETKIAVEWAEDPRCKVDDKVLRARLTRYGWEAERAISTPSRSH